MYNFVQFLLGHDVRKLIEVYLKYEIVSNLFQLVEFLR